MHVHAHGKKGTDGLQSAVLLYIAHSPIYMGLSVDCEVRNTWHEHNVSANATVSDSIVPLSRFIVTITPRVRRDQVIGFVPLSLSPENGLI